MLSPKAVIIEDFPDWREKIARKLEEAGCVVVAKIATYHEGLRILPELKTRGVNFLILDGCLDRSSDDGNEIGRRCHQIAPDVIRIGMSRYMDGVTEVDIVVGKENLDDLPEVIAQLLRQVVEV
jgi:hypothetical protein